MKYFLPLCLIATLLLMDARLSQAGEFDFPPEKAQQIINVEVMGVTLGSTMGEIKKRWGAQGFDLDCSSRRGCKAKKGTIYMDAGYETALEKHDGRPMDNNRTPVSISYANNVSHGQICGQEDIFQNALSTFCPAGYGVEPCMQKKGQTFLRIRPIEASNDGYRYLMMVNINPQKSCRLKISRVQ